MLSTTLLVSAACGDSTGPGGSGGRPNQGGDGNGPATGGSGGGSAGGLPIGGEGAGPVGGAGGSAGGGEGGSGGEPPNPAPGAPGQSFVSSGNRASSTNYKLIHTTGQPTINQTQMTSPGYTLQGGLIGATGSQP